MGNISAITMLTQGLQSFLHLDLRLISPLSPLSKNWIDFTKFLLNFHTLWCILQFFFPDLTPSTRFEFKPSIASVPAVSVPLPDFLRGPSPLPLPVVNASMLLITLSNWNGGITSPPTHCWNPANTLWKWKSPATSKFNLHKNTFVLNLNWRKIIFYVKFQVSSHLHWNRFILQSSEIAGKQVLPFSYVRFKCSWPWTLFTSLWV